MFTKEYFDELYNLDLLDSENEAAFDNIVSLAANICKTEKAYITVLDTHRQWFKAAAGTEAKESSLDDSFCLHAVIADNPVMVVDNPTGDVRFYKMRPVLDGSIRYYAGVPIRMATGKAIGTLCVCNSQSHQLSQEQLDNLQLLAKQVDYLLRERLERRMADARSKEAAARAASYQSIVYMIAQELRTPVQNAALILQMCAEESSLDSRLIGLANMSQKQLNSILQSIKELLVISTRISDDTPLRKEVVDVCQLLQQVVDGQKKTSAQKGNAVEVFCQVEEEVFVDSPALQLIVNNLLSNANKFTEDGVITVEAYKIDECLLIKIKDTGTGMSIRTVAAINAGEMVTAVSGTREEKGLGAGLVLARQYLVLNNGELCVSSSINEGTVFTLKIRDVKFMKEPMLHVVRTELA